VVRGSEAARELSEASVAREDREVPDSPSPLETALDLLVYAPVGLALTLSEEMPRLAAKGRSRVEGQIAAARMVGRFAVGQGRRMMAGAPGPGSGASRPTPPPARPSPAPGQVASFPPADRRFSGPGSSESGPEGRVGGGSRPGPRRSPGWNVPNPPAGEGPEESSLAIPSYDSLSASQVVQRLASLGPDELDAVGRYEAARRGRRTILTRVAQLQGR
jgi:hypothetical protein